MSTERGHLSSADAAWLRMDRPTNLMVINSVLLFDEKLDWERFADVIRTRLVERYPRFGQRVAEGRLPGRGARWVQDTRFDMTRHLHHRGLAAPNDETALKQLVGDLASSPLDRGKPLWDMYLIDGPGEGCAVIVRMHHCIADGIALAEVMLSLTDSAPRDDLQAGSLAAFGAASRTTSGGGASGPVASLAAAGEALYGGIPVLPGALSTARRATSALTQTGLRTLANPQHGIELAHTLSADARALAKLLLTSPDTPSVLKGDHGAAREVAWSEPLGLERVKAIAKANGATVNDVLLAAVSGALRGHLLAQNEEPHEMRAFVPVNLRAADQPVPRELGNRFGLVYLTLPVDRSNRRERLSELKRRMDEIKNSPEGPVSYALLEAVGMTPPELESVLIDVFTTKATAVMTNVPGPRQTVYLAGSPLRAVLVWAPTAGSMGTSVSIFSYDGAVTVGLLVHAALVPDPQSIVDRLEREVAAMEKLTPRGPRLAVSRGP